MITQKGTNILLSVRVMPNAKRSGIEGVWNDVALKIALRAPAVDGQANKALIDFLADCFNVKKRQITIVRGETSREKTICFSECSLTDVQDVISKNIF